MRTTIDLNENLLRQAKELAMRTGQPLRAIIEDALRERFQRSSRQRKGGPVTLPVSRHRGELCPGIDLDNSAALLNLMESQ